MADAESGSGKQEYQIVHTPNFGKDVGETVELAPDVASAFEDNLVPADENVDASEATVRSQVVGASQGQQTLADQSGPIEAGEYQVYRDPIGDLQPGEVGEFEADVARAFADNLLPTGEDAESASDEDDAGGAGDETDPENNGDEQDVETEERSFNTPEEFLDRNVAPIKEDLEAADLDDDQLRKIRDTETAGQDRNGVTNKIDDLIEE